MFKRQSGHTHTTKCDFPLVCGGDIVWKQNGEKIHTLKLDYLHFLENVNKA